MVVVPSMHPEPFGLVAIEAISAGRPVVAARHDGLMEIVEDGKIGYTFTTGNLHDLAEKMALLLSDKNKMEQFGRNACNTILEKYTPEIHYNKLISLFNSVLPETITPVPLNNSPYDKRIISIFVNFSQIFYLQTTTA